MKNYHDITIKRRRRKDQSHKKKKQKTKQEIQRLKVFIGILDDRVDCRIVLVLVLVRILLTRKTRRGFCIVIAHCWFDPSSYS